MCVCVCAPTISLGEKTRKVDLSVLTNLVRLNISQNVFNLFEIVHKQHTHMHLHVIINLTCSAPFGCVIKRRKQKKKK